MADNSDNRKKALIISVLAFLFAGGGIFLFFVVQGANDLTGKAKAGKFTYGEAARESVASFFRTVGILPDDPIVEYGATKRPVPKSVLDNALAMAEAAKESPDGFDSWGGLRNGSSASPRPTSVPKLGAGKISGAGGIGGGGTKSSGSSSRFGDSPGRAASVSPGSRAAAPGKADKGTLASLKNTKALLGEGLRSGSAMTASDKWGQSFGVSGSRSGALLAYDKTGLVNLDKIKSGEIASLKMDAVKSQTPPEAGEFQQDKAAEAKDPTLQKAKADAEAAVKKAAAEAAAKAAADAALKTETAPTTRATPSGDSPTSRSSGDGSSSICDPNQGPQTQVCSEAVERAIFPGETASFESLGKDTNGAAIYAVKFDSTAGTQNAFVTLKPDGNMDWNYGEYRFKQ